VTTQRLEERSCKPRRPRSTAAEADAAEADAAEADAAEADAAALNRALEQRADEQNGKPVRRQPTWRTEPVSGPVVALTSQITVRTSACQASRSG
jgi:transcription elongation GreA/GreB family factor